jgi:hypothetical protein
MDSSSGADPARLERLVPFNKPLRRRYLEGILAPATALGEAALAAPVEAGEPREGG